MDLKKITNCSIILASIKNKPEDICNSIVNLDEQVLTLEKL
jgi:hypothetical protein